MRVIFCCCCCWRDGIYPHCRRVSLFYSKKQKCICGIRFLFIPLLPWSSYCFLAILYLFNSIFSYRNIAFQQQPELKNHTAQRIKNNNKMPITCAMCATHSWLFFSHFFFVLFYISRSLFHRVVLFAMSICAQFSSFFPVVGAVLFLFWLLVDCVGLQFLRFHVIKFFVRNI